MSHSIDFGKHKKTIHQPDNPRESMEPEADMSPDDARQFIFDLMRAIHNRMNEMPDDDFEKPERHNHLPAMEKAKQYYGNDTYQLLSGIEAALREWDPEHPQDIQELKEKYQGRFVEGVEIGHRLAVYEGRDFTFSANESEPEEQESDSKFTFST